MGDDLDAAFQRERLHRAAREGDLTEVQKLLASKYPVNRFDELGNTPLHYAVEGEHIAMVDALLRAGANVNAHDERLAGDTPLGKYAGSCSCEIAQRLIDVGADPTIPGWMNMTAIDRAKYRKDSGGERILALFRSVRHRKW